MFKGINYSIVTTYSCPCNGVYKGMIAEETIFRTHFEYHANLDNFFLKKICTINLIFYFIFDDINVDIHTDVTFEDSEISTRISIYSANSSCSNTFKVNTRKCLLITVWKINAHQRPFVMTTPASTKRIERPTTVTNDNYNLIGLCNVSVQAILNDLGFLFNI